MSNLWKDFSLTDDQGSLLHALASSFGLWYPEKSGFVVPTLVRRMEGEKPPPPIRSLTKTIVQWDPLPSTEYQILIKIVFPSGMPEGRISVAFSAI